VELRYRAVLAVLAGESVTAVAARYGASRQSVYCWVERYRDEGLVGLQDRSRRPVSCPQRIPAELESLVCELRRTWPRWGARRIVHELTRRKVEPVPSRSTVYRALVRNDLVEPQEQQHKRKYKRLERDAPMQLWQMDIMSGVFLVGGRECKLVTGIDDHSRYVVVAKVVVRPTGRAVCDALAEAVERHGVPSELLTDNGKQFTGRFTKPLPAEVLFERFCRENGITQLLTKRRSPTTTGKIERWHQTLRHELLDECGEFADIDAAQAAIDAWVSAYNTERPHQALGMRTPSQRFRPAPPTALDRLQGTLNGPTQSYDASPASSRAVAALPAPMQRAGQPQPFELDLLVPAGGCLSLAGTQQVWLGPALSGRIVTVWVDRHSPLCQDLVRQDLD
jgi:transposase InsO family protein